jgi:hypothetical protein
MIADRRNPKESAGSALAETLRAAFAESGVPESLDEIQEGYYFAIEDDDEVLVHYNAAQNRAGTSWFDCCLHLSQNGYTVSLFLSPRTAALAVRSE